MSRHTPANCSSCLQKRRNSVLVVPVFRGIRLWWQEFDPDARLTEASALETQGPTRARAIVERCAREQLGVPPDAGRARLRGVFAVAAVGRSNNTSLPLRGVRRAR